MHWKVSLEQYGYAIVADMLTHLDVEEFAQGLLQAELPRSRAGIRHAMRHPAVAELARSGRFVGMARRVLGPDAIPFRATLFDKSPGSNWLVVWHQDTALPMAEKRDCQGWGPWSVKDGVNYAHAPAYALEKVLALRLHLDDSRADNGPLRILPGTHTLGVLSDGQIHLQSERVAPVDGTVPRGGVLAMRPLVVHASSKSQSAAPRRVLHIEYCSSLIPADGLALAIS